MTPAPDCTSSFLDFEPDRRSPVPAHIQISDAIRDRIEAGELLASSHSLCEKLGITRMTLRQAYAVLERDGIIVDRTLSRMVGFSEEPSDFASGFLDASEVYRIERLRVADREPMAIERVEISSALCAGLERFDLATESLYGVLDREYHVRFTRCEQVVCASTPDSRQRNAETFTPHRFPANGAAPVCADE